MVKKKIVKKKVEMPAQELGPRLVGDVVEHPLDAVQPNDWNPNAFTPFGLLSLKQGLEKDGWLKSQSLLVWRTDEEGRKRMVIIDGEHRWLVARDLGFKVGPMVFLDGITEARAKALTVKLDAKRGNFDEEDLGELVRSLQHDLGDEESLSLSLGLPEEQLMKLLAEPPEEMEPEEEPAPPGEKTSPGEVPSGMASHVRMVQLFFNKEQHEEFLGLVKKLGAEYETKDVTSTALEAMRRAARHPAT